MNNIPSVDLADFLSDDPDRKQKFVNEIGSAYEEIGFVSLKNHFLEDDLVDNLYKEVKSFFALPTEVKESYEIDGLGGQRGYISFGKEHAKGRKKGDLKEFYHIGDPTSNVSPENIWPIEINEFQEITSKAFLKLEEIGLQVLESTALYLDLEKNYFYDKVKGGQSIMRAIHYYPINPDDVSDGAVRAAAHGDINFITLLMGASADGLEILTRDNRWNPIKSKPDQLVINVGDMLERLTNNKLMSTIHRVVNPSRDLLNTSRYSIPFFLSVMSRNRFLAAGWCKSIFRAYSASRMARRAGRLCWSFCAISVPTMPLTGWGARIDPSCNRSRNHRVGSNKNGPFRGSGSFQRVEAGHWAPSHRERRPSASIP